MNASRSASSCVTDESPQNKHVGYLQYQCNRLDSYGQARADMLRFHILVVPLKKYKFHELVYAPRGTAAPPRRDDHPTPRGDHDGGIEVRYRFPVPPPCAGPKEFSPWAAARRAALPRLPASRSTLRWHPLLQRFCTAWVKEIAPAVTGVHSENRGLTRAASVTSTISVAGNLVSVNR